MVVTLSAWMVSANRQLVPGSRASTIEGSCATLGKLLQVSGLVLLPVSMMMQVTGGVRASTGGGFTVSAMLLLMVFGVVLFSCGRIVEGYAKT